MKYIYLKRTFGCLLVSTIAVGNYADILIVVLL